MAANSQLDTTGTSGFTPSPEPPSLPSRSNQYMSDYMVRRYHRIHDAAVILLGGKCNRCGSIEKLQFDHIDRSTKLFEIGRNAGSFSKPRLLTELAKCQLLCPPCHHYKTALDLGKTPAKGSHGTISSWRYCKCDECKAAKSRHNKTYYQKMKARRAQ